MELCVILERVNNIFDLVLMIYIITAMLNLIAILYYTYEQFVENYRGFPFPFGSIALYMMDAFFTYFKIALVSHICQNTIVEVNTFTPIVNIAVFHIFTLWMYTHLYIVYVFFVQRALYASLHL